jgi:hypothetical protein
MRKDDSLDARLALEVKKGNTCREREERAKFGLDGREAQTYIGPRLPRGVFHLLR